MHRLGLAVGVLGVICVFAACVGSDPAPVVESPDASPSDAGGSSSSSSSGSVGAPDSSLAPDAAPSLQCPTGCLPPAPPGWTGPSAVYDGAPAGAPTSCTGAYPSKEITTSHWKELGPAQCTCGSSTASGVECDLTETLYGSSTCTGTPTTTSYAIQVNGAMHPQCISPGGAAAILSGPSLKATCSTPSPPSNPVTVDAVQLSCGQSAPTACTGRSDCVATPLPLPDGFARLCIHHEGDVQCPSVDYIAKIVAGKGVSDTRSCTPCETKLNGGCGTTIVTNQDSSCTVGTGTTENAAGACLVGGKYADVSGVAPVNVSCTVTNGIASGELAMTDVITYCCHQ